MAECPNCGTEVRPEWSLCPHCKVNMRSYAGPPGGYVHPVTPIPAAPVPVEPVRAAPAPPPPAPAAPAAPTVCPNCNAALPSPDAPYCTQCGEPVTGATALGRMRRFFANRYLVGALAAVFVLLIVGIVLAGQFSGATVTATGPITGGNTTPSPTVTIAPTRNVSPAVTTGGQSPFRLGGNATVNATPVPFETVLAVKTLSRYIQNAGGDPSQIRTPTIRTPPPTPTPVPTSASQQVGNLSWTGEGTYVTDPFPLQAGVVQISMTARVLTMAQLRDTAGTAVGVATAGPQPATTQVRIPVTGMYRLEIWPFGSGAWTVTIADAPVPTTVATTVTIPTLAPITTGAETTAPAWIPTPTPIPTSIETPTPTPTPVQTQEPRTISGGDTANTTVATNRFPLYEGLATFTYSTTANGTFALTLVGSGETVLVPPTEGPLAGSKGVMVPSTGEYLLNVVANGQWTVSIS